MAKTGLLFLVSIAAGAQDVPSRAMQLLEARCLACHSGATRLSGLDLATREGALKGGTRGTALGPNGTLLPAVMRTGKLAMPPTGALTAEEIALLRQWIEDGARWPAGQTRPNAQPQWWSFRKPVRPAVPRSGSPWVRNEIDEFVLAGMRRQNLQPAAEASPATLIRRLYFDLTGLPPTAAEVQAFAADPSPKAYETLVERLLASPHYGERWGRHWLDLVRYSDTAGFELDSYIPDAWRYRDWVIRAFNDDKPYDRFLKEQLAGDEVAPEDPAANTGTGYFCVGPNRDYFPEQADINRIETLTDFVDTTGGVFLGLTVGCARCHDHKYDPIPQKDYYRLQAVFAPAVKVKVALDRLSSLGWDVAENNREIKLREIGEQIGAIQQRCAEKLETTRPDGSKARPSDDKIRACLSPEETERLDAIGRRLVTMFASFRAKPFACGVTDVGDYSPKTYLPVKGQAKGEEVRPGFPGMLGGGDIPEMSFERPATGPIPLAPTTGRRKALADWLASAEHPLTARVMVNRIWHYHFGRGIVATPSDFGAKGRAPSHPELLDWLATEFAASGWSVKAMHRRVLLSATYRQSANGSAEALSRDPENSLLSHFRRRRLDAEEVRDAVLLTGGALNRKRGGRPVVVPLSEEERYNLIGRADDMWVVTNDAREHTRRSIYLFQRRTFRLPMMEVFDAPESMLTCSRRDASTTAPQSLSLLNGRFTLEAAQQLADKLAPTADPVGEAWRAILGREPDAGEAAEARRFLDTQKARFSTPQGALIELLRGLWNVNEFLYVD